jgi:hypothetical protein
VGRIKPDVFVRRGTLLFSSRRWDIRAPSALTMDNSSKTLKENQESEGARRCLILNSTGGNRENGARKPALFSLFPPVRVHKKTKLSEMGWFHP